MANKRADIGRLRRQARVRKKIIGTDARPRICVYRSNKHIYAQVISDHQGRTLAASSTLAKDRSAEAKQGKGVASAKEVGLALAKACKEKNITKVIFDRNGFLFHGQVKAVADGAREGGLEF